MKTLITSAIIFLSIVMSTADAMEKTSCTSRFKNADDRAFCIATSRNNQSACNQISDSDKRNFCVAQTTLDGKHCSEISSDYSKKQCLVMTSRNNGKYSQ